MPHIFKQQSCPYTPQQMFALVANFTDYPKFIPFCDAASSRQVSEHEIEGTLYMNKGPFRKSFTTRNRATPPQQIDIALVNGPFRQLTGQWQFLPHSATPQGCLVKLDLHYEMSSGLLAVVMGGIFETIAKSMVEAFCREADRRYAQAHDSDNDKS